jgi:hypothetical protein
MNALAANDFQAADLLALARLDDGTPGPGSRCSAIPSRTACWTTTAARSRHPNHPGYPCATIYRTIHQYEIITPAS